MAKKRAFGTSGKSYPDTEDRRGYPIPLERKEHEEKRCRLDYSRDVGTQSPSRVSNTVSLDRVASAIAPSVHGLHHIKKGLLLMLLGGVSKSSGTGPRGNIHVCLLGDTATAKSTLLRWIASACPSSIYTSGASATSAGLMSALVSDGVDKVIKPGALVMAAGGVCCIDNFEQLKPSDQHAIREVMDQQTVTITKAGICTKLKADTSVFAACLPKGGGSYPHRHSYSSASLPENVKQCFDLIYAMPDTQDSDCDEEIAWHILASAASHTKQPSTELALPQLQSFIKYARSLRPTISHEASEKLQFHYRRMRERAMGNPRILENLIRLAEAVARGNLVEDVAAKHVDEAFQIMEASIDSLNRFTSGSSPRWASCSGA